MMTTLTVTAQKWKGTLNRTNVYNYFLFNTNINIWTSNNKMIISINAII